MRQLIALSLTASLFLILFSAPLGAQNVLKLQGKQTGTKSSRKSILGNIKDESVFEGCGCYFSYPSESRKRFPKYVFASGFDEKTGWMNIDGRDVKLRLTSSTRPKGREKIGSRLTRTYEAAGIKVSVAYITTRLCKPNDENCESTDYDATVTVTKGDRKQTVTLKGGCGC